MPEGETKAVVLPKQNWVFWLLVMTVTINYIIAGTARTPELVVCYQFMVGLLLLTGLRVSWAVIANRPLDRASCIFYTVLIWSSNFWIPTLLDLVIRVLHSKS